MKDIPERREDGKWIRNIKFRFPLPILRHGKEVVRVDAISLDKEQPDEHTVTLAKFPTLETVVAPVSYTHLDVYKRQWSFHSRQRCEIRTFCHGHSSSQTHLQQQYRAAVRCAYTCLLYTSRCV